MKASIIQIDSEKVVVTYDSKEEFYEKCHQLEKEAKQSVYLLPRDKDLRII